MPWPLALGTLRRAAVRHLQNDAGGVLQSQSHYDAVFHFHPIRRASLPLTVGPSVTREPGPSRVTTHSTQTGWAPHGIGLLVLVSVKFPLSSPLLSPRGSISAGGIAKIESFFILRPVSRQDRLCVTTPIHPHPHPPTDSLTFV